MAETLPEQATAPHRATWQRASVALLGGLLLVSAYVPLVRTLTGNDFDWPALLNELHGRNLAFGSEIVFTFGPWGFVWGGYHPRTFWITCIVWSLLAAAVAWVMVRIAFVAAPGSSMRAGAILLGLILVLGGDYNCAPDVRLLALPILAVFYHFFVRPRGSDLAMLALVAAMGFAGMIKFTPLVAGGFAVITICLDQLFRRDYRLHSALAWLVAVLAAWLLAGQTLGGLPAYIRRSLELTAAYPDAMGLRSENEWSQLLGFLIAAVVLMIYLVMVSRAVLGRRAALFLIGTFGLLFIVYRSGFVRHDVHELTATMLFLFCAVLTAAVSWRSVHRRGVRGVGIASIALTALVAARSLSDWHGVSIPRLLAGTVWNAAEETAELARIAAGRPSMVSEQWNREMADIRQSVPLPPVSGGVDLFPRVATAVLANGLEYRPRPTLQSYAAMTPRHAALNATALSRPDAPENLFVSVERDSERFVTIDDSRCWLEFVTQYRTGQVAGDYTHLVRRDKPRETRSTLLQDLSVPLGQQIPVPPLGSTGRPALLWAMIDVPATPIGWLVGQLYRPPPLYIRVWTHGGKTAASRLVRNIAADGFLLGPIPLDQSALLTLLADEPDPAAFTALSPQAIAIGMDDPTVARWTAAPDVRIRFYRLDIVEPE